MKNKIFQLFVIILAVTSLAACASRISYPQEDSPGGVLPGDAPAVESGTGAVASPADMTKAMFELADPLEAQPAPVQVAPDAGFNTDEYNKITENEFKDARQNPLSTFSIDVDKASYANVRSYLDGGILPPPDAVRIEELINYFSYDYPEPTGEHPFSITTELTETPWNPESRLFMIGIQGKRLDYQNLQPCNLVFLIDTSGSMGDANKLPLLKEALGLLVKNLSAKDKIAIVAYAGSAGIVLESTPASSSRTILRAMDDLSSGGSTAGGAGIELAYKTARENYIPGGNNRVILCTDGDFNVGTSSTGSLVDLITEKRKEDIYLTICGFGMGNYKDGRMEEISKAGNGNYFYIDSRKEAEKVFVKEMRANMFTIAKDVKIQLEFNPAVVKAYRLIGYENRLMAAEDFKDDTKDAGELGPGHSVTALYEILLADSSSEVRSADDLKYQDSSLSGAADSGELLTVKFRYKPITSDASIPIERTVGTDSVQFGQASGNLRFAASVAGFGMLLRESKFSGTANWDSVIKLATSARGRDEEGYRAEFIDLARKAATLSRAQQ
ncbi:MAG: von Willebrand factor type A domain-containing protein [Spirochaetia bacterium]|jgi:Ca-activated chloride channel family protein|nr:von Willebrand factor type A domain-containing protein [Spirochaetia bacterium]